MTGKLLKIVLGVIAVSFLAKLAFGLTMILSIQSFLAKESAKYPDPEPTPFVAGGVPSLPDIRYSKNLARPLLLEERARLSMKLKGVLGTGTDGWKLRYNTRKDAIALRPDRADCLRYEQTDCYTVATRHAAEIFSKGKKRLYVHIRLRGGGFHKAIENDEFNALNKKFKNASWSAMRPGWAKSEYLKKEWKTLEPWKGFTLERMENHGGKGAYFLKATREGEGTVVMTILSNAPLDEVKAQLAAMDLDLLHAMVAPVPFGGKTTLEDHITAELAKRAKSKSFKVLTNEEIRKKVATMPAQSRIRYVSNLYRHAARHDNSPYDYKVLYQPLGEEGLNDTKEFLSEQIAKNDPRYDVLATEQSRRLNIGSCLLTAVGRFCHDEAEGLRIALEVQRQATTARTKLATPTTPEAPKQAYLQEMKDLETQMEQILQRHIAQIAGD